MNGHRSSSNNSDNLPLSVTIHTKSHQLLFGIYMYSITCPLILITLPAAILNLPINFFCPQDTALVLTSDNLHLIFPLTPHPSPLPVSQPPDDTFQKHPHEAIFTVFSHTFTLFWSRMASVIAEIFQVSVCLCSNVLSSRDLFIVWWVFSFLPIYWVFFFPCVTCIHYTKSDHGTINSIFIIFGQRFY